MSNIPRELRYAKTHEWARLEGDGTATIGITDYAQSSLGDITYVQAPKIGASLKAGEILGAVESVKAASDLYAPLSGEVVAVNGALESAPETVNREPFGAGWIARIRLASPAEASALLDAAAYAALTA
jgi:glycine cleavage system H protein